MYLKTRDAGLVCRRCGISRPPLRLWVRRYEEQGPAGLIAKSHRPHTAPGRKVFEQQEQWILELRHERNLGARRIQHELQRLHHCTLSSATIQRVLHHQHVPSLRRHRRPEEPRRSSREVPGACIQMDTIKIAPGLYQYTAIDDCSRYLVVALFPRRTAANTLLFLEQVLDELPFPIQRLQTDHGTEFTAYAVQDFLLENAIKFRPIPIKTPHLNGKVERAQQTVLTEFYATANLKVLNLEEELGVWQLYYNYQRVHGSLGVTPMQRVCERFPQTPFSDEVQAGFQTEVEAARVNKRLLASLRRQVKGHA
jgi:transposase InsO family protein